MVVALDKTQRFMSKPGVSLVFQLTAVVSLLLGLFVGWQQVKYSHCVADYNNRASAVSTQRSQALQSTTDAVDKFIQAIAHSGSLPVDQRANAIRTAFETYLKTRAAADEQRKLNPLPEPPSETC